MENGLKITEIRFVRIKKDAGPVKAEVTVTLNNALAIHGVKIVRIKDRLKVTMPSRKDNNGKYVDIVHPVSHKIREYLENEVLDYYFEETIRK